jgi:hypothetical protein
VQAEARLIEESGRVTHYLNASTEPKLRQIVEHELVEVHATTLVEVGIDARFMYAAPSHSVRISWWRCVWMHSACMRHCSFCAHQLVEVQAMTLGEVGLALALLMQFLYAQPSQALPY